MQSYINRHDRQEKQINNRQDRQEKQINRRDAERSKIIQKSKQGRFTINGS
jgi:hypothetical protein